VAATTIQTTLSKSAMCVRGMTPSGRDSNEHARGFDV
jgi:hypothetical protein